MSELRTFGWLPSKIDETINIYDIDNPSDQSIYNRKATMPIIDQGNEASCVSQTCYELYGFYQETHNQINDITPTWIYRRRRNKGEDGMMCRDAFEILKNNDKINGFAKINNIVAVKHAILTFGGVLLAVKVYNSSINDFWIGKELEGGHAVCGIGYDENYIYFKNSWGTSYGKNGLWKLPISEFSSKVCEVWAITS